MNAFANNGFNQAFRARGIQRQNWLAETFKTLFETGQGAASAIYTQFDRCAVQLFRVRPSDPINKLIGKYFSIFLIFVTCLIGADRFMAFSATSIDCLKPVEYYDKKNNDQKEQDVYKFMVDYCSSIPLYYIPTGDGIIPPKEIRIHQPRVSHYQWVGLILICAACMLSIPSIAFITLCNLLDLPFDTLTGYVEKVYELEEGDRRKQEFAKYVERIHGWFHVNKRHRGRRDWGRAWFAYLTVKLLYIVILSVLFFFLDRTIGHQFWNWGFDIVKAFYDGSNMEEKPIFARMVLCDVPFFLLGDQRIGSLQCHLKVNALLEKLFFIIWCALFALGSLAFGSFLVILLHYPRKTTDLKKVYKMLSGHKHCLCLLDDDENNEIAIKEFRKFLGHDGVLFFELLEYQVGIDLTNDLFVAIFEQFLSSDPTYAQHLLKMNDLKKSPEAPEKKEDGTGYGDDTDGFAGNYS